MARTGRPSKFTPALAAEMCDLIANGIGLQEICRREEMPHRVTVLRWLDANEEFRTQYARARDLQADHFAEEIVEIADDGTNDWTERQRKDGSTETVLDREHVSRSQLRVDARKWLMARMAPKKYGEKTAHEFTGKDGVPLIPAVLNVTIDGNKPASPLETGGSPSDEGD